MKVIQSGLRNKKGITLQCECCGCVYMIENKKDWKIHIINSIKGNKYIEYYINCPDCGESYYIGVDCNEYNRKEEGNLLSKFRPIFDREDWEERYKLNIEEVL